jgi:hypothetical protein
VDGGSCNLLLSVAKWVLISALCRGAMVVSSAKRRDGGLWRMAGISELLKNAGGWEDEARL